MELRKEKEAPAATTFLSPQMIFLTLISRQLLDIFLWNKPAKYVYLKMEVTPIIKGPGRVDLCFLIKTNFLCLNLKSKSLSTLS